MEFKLVVNLYICKSTFLYNPVPEYGTNYVIYMINL